MFHIISRLQNSISLNQLCGIKVLRIGNRLFTSPSAAAETSANIEVKWQVIASACITRAPIISPEMSPLESSYKNLLHKIEVENSLKSDHELRLIEEQIQSDLINAGKIEDINMEEAAKQTGAEFEDAGEEEFKTFKFASRTTEADESLNLASLNRALDRALVLTVKQKLGSQHYRILPQTPWSPGETLRQSCERVVKKVCGNRVKVKILGNAPCGFFKYKYPKEVRKEGFIGAKVFFFSGHVYAYDFEGLEQSDEFHDHQWLTHEELATSLSKSYYQAISKFLVSDK